MSDYSDDDDDGPARPQLLPVANFTDYDPSKPPASGQDYLRRVQIEAERCPDIVVSNLDPSKFEKRGTNMTEQSSSKVINGNAAANPVLAPSLDWQQSTVAEFSQLRLKVETFRDNVLSAKEIVKFPAKADMSWWRKHCLGTGLKRPDSGAEGDSSEAVASTDSSSGDDDADVDESKDDEAANGTLGAASKASKGQAPLLRQLCSLNQYQLCKLLVYHTKWIKQFGFFDQNGLWVYSLMACLEKPLQSEVYANLRDICRACLDVRSTLEAGHPLVNSLNLIIYIVGCYFDQVDLIKNV